MYSPADDAVPALIAAEREASRTADLALLSVLWADDARIVDGRSTSDSQDDFVWEGKSAILDRYMIAVFPAPPPALDATQLASLRFVEREPNRIVAELGVDRWTFVRNGDRWYIAELRYN